MNLSPSFKTFTALGILLASLAFQSASADPNSPRYLDIPSLLEGRASQDTSPLLEGVEMPRFQPATRHGTYHLSAASLFRRDGGSDGFLVISRRDDGAFTALVSTSGQRGLVIGDADGSQVFKPEQPFDESSDADMVPGSEETRLALEAARKNPQATPSGNTVLTVAVGFSPESAAFVKDPTGFALAQLEVANLQFINTGLAIRLSLAGIENIPVDLPIEQQTLLDLRWQMKNPTAADLISAFFLKRPGDTVAGIAFRNDRFSTQSVETTDTFAHEIGHNAGGKHCYSGEPEYYFGFRIGDKGTSLCRGPIRRPYYSTSERNDADGVALGDASTADMARVWREAVPVMAAYGDKQRVTKPFHLFNMGNGQCLSGATGGSVQFEKCEAGKQSQQWTEWPNDPFAFLRWAGDERSCLFVDADDGLAIRLIPCANQQYSRWILRDDARIWTTYRGSENRDHYLASVGQGRSPTVLRGASINDPDALWVRYEPAPGLPVLLKNDLAGLCAQVRDGKHAVGSVIEFAACATGTAQQRWLWDDKRIRLHGQQDLCLGNDGYRAQLQACDWVDDSVLWTRSDGKIRNERTHGCLASHPDHMAAGDDVWLMAGCDGEWSPWTEVPSP